jgi:hypothetical protein
MTIQLWTPKAPTARDVCTGFWTTLLVSGYRSIGPPPVIGDRSGSPRDGCDVLHTVVIAIRTNVSIAVSKSIPSNSAPRQHARSQSTSHEIGDANGVARAPVAGTRRACVRAHGCTASLAGMVLRRTLRPMRGRDGMGEHAQCPRLPCRADSAGSRLGRLDQAAGQYAMYDSGPDGERSSRRHHGSCAPRARNTDGTRPDRRRLPAGSRIQGRRLVHLLAAGPAKLRARNHSCSCAGGHRLDRSILRMFYSENRYPLFRVLGRLPTLPCRTASTLERARCVRA